MSGLPADDAGWFELIRENQPPLWRLLAEACGGRVLEDGDIMAAVVAASPNRSFFNSVWYRDADRLAEALLRLADAYEEAGVDAWTVWIPNDDERAREALDAAGHVLDATPRAMALELSGLQAPEPDPALEIRAEMDMVKLREINAVSYGWATEDFPPFEPLPDTDCYLADLDGETVGTVLTWDRGVDTEILFVATLPEARGRGVARRLLGHALEVERKRGKQGTTLISTKLGYPVYTALGYRQVGGFEMWERRR